MDSVTTSRYAAVLQNYVIPELTQRNELNDIVWMQDGALPHVQSAAK